MYATFGRKIHNGTNICPVCNEQLASKRNYFRHLGNHSIDIDDKEQTDETESSSTVEAPALDGIETSIADNPGVTEADDEQIYDADALWFDEEMAHQDCDSDADDDTEEEMDEDVSPETWENLSEEDLNEDLGLPVQTRSGIKNVNDLLFWFLFFILYWQSIFHLSDCGIELLLKFLFQFFNVLHLKIDHFLLAEFSVVFPTSVYMLRKLLKLDRDNFERYVVCQECFSVYDFFNCFTEVNGIRKTKLCNHETVVRGRSKTCDTPLLKEVVLKGGVVKLYPYKIYCFNSLINRIEQILQKNNIPDIMCHWKDWQGTPQCYKDIYDGRVWKEFKEFFKGDRNLGLMLNIDWFQPFKNRNDYSVGVIYFVILNLPRHIRFKFENVIIVGIIPALRKEPKDLTPFLKPIVKELQALWKGVLMKTSLSSIALTIRAALVCVACDIPAARKTCGFKSHSASLGCHRCYKNFPAASFGAKRNYGGFDRQKWKLRTKRLHNQYSHKVKNARNKTEFNNLSRKFGTYYSILIELDYFDAVRFCIVDPMHNLFLGTSKSMFKLWTKNNILDEGKIEIVESRLKSMNDVTDIGRIPHRISSNYGCYSAVEWKNWTIIYSLFCLIGVLPTAHFKVWEKFVLACKILCNPFLTLADITKADLILVQFCKDFETLYGWEHVKPNMHLHCHLKECLLDFGPVHVFWCFSFERFNGKFGHFTTNNRCVEIQFMRQLVTARHCEKLLEIGSNNDLHHFFQLYLENESIQQIHTPSIVQFLQMSKTTSLDMYGIVIDSYIKVPNFYKISALETSSMVHLLECYRQMYPTKCIQITDINEVIRKFGHIVLVGERFGSRMDCRSSKSANILANWHCKENDIDVAVDSIGLKPCSIEFFFSHVLSLDGEEVRHYFCKVKWFKEYEDRNKYGSLLQMWHFRKFEDCHSSRFLPVQRIRSRFVYGLTGESKDLMVVSQIPRKIYSDNTAD